MVETLQPEWRVETIEPIDDGTDFVARLEVVTPSDGREVICKAVTSDHVPAASARAEPYMLARVATETDIPVPELYGSCAEHPAYPAPFSLMASVDGEQYEKISDEIDDRIRAAVLRDAAQHLATLHELAGFEAVGRLGVTDNELHPVSVEHAPPGDTRQWALTHAERAIDSLHEGGHFTHLDDQESRFADLAPDLRAVVREKLPALAAPDGPRLTHIDYRFGNLIVDDSGVKAVLDWGNLLAVEPAYALAVTEGLLTAPELDGEDRTAELRELFRETYSRSREGWVFTAERERRMELYKLVYRLDAMACLPLWRPPGERDRYEQRHRSFVAEYL